VGRFNSRRNCRRRTSFGRSIRPSCIRDLAGIGMKETVRAIRSAPISPLLFARVASIFLFAVPANNLQVVGRPRRGSQLLGAMRVRIIARMKSDPTYGQRWPAHARFAPKIPRLCHGSMLSPKCFHRAAARARCINSMRFHPRSRSSEIRDIGFARRARRGISTAADIFGFSEPRDTTSA